MCYPPVTLSERVLKEFVLTVRSISISLWPNKMLVHLHLYAPLKPLNLDFLRAKLCYLSTMTQSPALFTYNILFMNCENQRSP